MLAVEFLYSSPEGEEFSIQGYGEKSYLIGLVRHIEGECLDGVTTKAKLEDLKEIHSKLGRFIENATKNEEVYGR
jgi:hypothetical protein